jgi:hypothetical protein
MTLHLVELSDIIFEGDHPTTQHLGKYTQHNEISTYHNPVVTLHSVVLAQRKKLLSSSNVRQFHPISKMATTGEHSLTLDTMGNYFKNLLIRNYLDN